MDQREQKRRLLKSTFAVSGPTVLSRILGYCRDMIQAFYLGTSRGADAFTVAYIIPNLLRRLTGEGTMTAAFVPIFTQVKKEKSKEELWKFANTFFYDLTLLIALLAVLGIVLSPLLVKIIAFGYKQAPGKLELTIVLTRIMFPYIFLISLAALAMAILNSLHKFAVPALTPALFNLAIITLAVVFARKMEEPAYIFAVGIVVGGLFQIAFQLPFLWKKGMRFTFGLSFAQPAIRKVAMLMVPGIFGVGITQINIAVSRMLASLLEEGSVSSLYYATRIRELALGLFSIALSIALLPLFSEQAAHRDIAGMKKTLIFSLKLIFFITFPAMVGLLVLNRPIVQVLFQRGLFGAQSTTMSATCLLFFSIGLPFISSAKILAPVFYSLKDTKTPVIIAFFVMTVYLLLSFILMNPLKVGGLALALSLAEAFNLLLLFFFLERKIGKVEKKEIFSSALKSAFSAASMGAVIWFLIEQVDFQKLEFLSQLGALFGTILLGVLTYVLLSLLFNNQDLKSLKDILSKERIVR
ncbi:MAG: murein biosynthesis integral membrane protein MurJ [Candidatus Aminicenantaceae bacterium]